MPTMRLLVAIVIVSTYVSTTFSKVRHERSRGKRQEDWAPSSWVWDDDIRGGGSGGGDWGPWEHPSPCSRPCGGGISSQNRTCRSEGRCWGSGRRYFSCNIQDCPDDTDFRAEQCAAYNTIPYEEIYYDWIPYTKAPNKCALNCMPRGERFYYRHQDKVIDGTRCDEEGMDVCVDGKCMHVGCDKMLNSTLREDSCRVCGGDGSSCDTRRDIIYSDDFKVGYNDLFMVPSGATNLVVKEVKASNNYLAVRNASNHYYLNGDWRIDYPRTLKFAGTTFHYGRKPHGFFAPESITALGPTTEIIFIVLLYQETNPGIEYEYSLPKGKVIQTDPEGYTWFTDDFSECSATCGGGFQSRAVWCAKVKDMMEANAELCDPAQEPASTQACSADACPPQWHLPDWSPCSVTCGNGTQSRQVYCEQIVSGGQSVLLNESICLKKVGEKPELTQPCGDDSPCPAWHLGPWKPCDNLCGDGKQRRVVQCFNVIDGKKEVLPDSFCGETKPETEMDCFLKPCEGTDWATGEWSGCEDKCGLAIETRDVMCINQEGKLYPDEYCHDYRKPPQSRNCSMASCLSQWYASQWSSCSSKCGPGIQTREVFCATYEDNSLVKVNDSECDASLKFTDQQPCVGEGECKGEWFIGPFDKCSKPCGGGQRSRKTLCFKDNEKVDFSECDENSDVFITSPCNTHPCGEDETIPVEPDDYIMEESSEECEEDYDEKTEDEDEDEGQEDKSVESVEVFDDIKSMTGPIKLELEEGSGDGSTTLFSSSTSPSSEGSSTDLTDSTKETSPFSSSTTSEDELTSEPVGSSEGSTSSGSTVSGTQVSESTTSAMSSTGASETSLSSSTVSAELSTDSSTSSSSDQTTISTSSSDSTDDTTGTSSSTDSSTSGSSVTSSSSGTSGSTLGEESSPTTESASSSTETSETPTTETPTTETPTTESDMTSATTLSSSEGSSSSDSSSTSWATSVMTSLMSLMTTDSTTDSSTESSSSTVSLTSESSSVSSESTSSETSSSSDTTESSSQSTPSLTTDSSTLSSSEGSTVSGEMSETSSTDATQTTESGMTSESTEMTSESTGMTSESTGMTSESTGMTSESTGMTSESTGMTSSTEYYSSVSTEEAASDTATTADTSFTTSSWSEVLLGVTKEQKPKKCKKRVSKCIKSEFGCCPDKKTPAKGPFGKDCPRPKTCQETTFGCCEDGVSVALGKGFKGCPASQCNMTLFGCCPNEQDAAMGNNFEGCPEETTVTMDCTSSTYGCCPDGIISATGPNNTGCFDCEDAEPCETCFDTKFGCCPDNISQALGPDFLGCDVEMSTKAYEVTLELEEDCQNSTFGCCPDGESSATGPQGEGCPVLECYETRFGCCPDGNSSASGPNFEGCGKICIGGEYGCCDDNETLAHGPNKEGCCSNTTFGCCQDNVQPALGPNYYGCRCESGLYGCCPDGVTYAKGPSGEGCSCQSSAYGCCPDNATPALGSDFHGCSCHTYQFGCCPDGVSHAVGPRMQGCRCEETELGCCPDGVTPKPEDGTCACDVSKYGCCLDGTTEARGEKFEGCEEKPLIPGDICGLPKDRGPCREFAVRWHYDTQYAGCSRFWYGSCEGNDNRFNSEEECKSVCIEPKGTDACGLPKMEGPCNGYYPRWYYDSSRKVCSQFIYKGCLGNNNRFSTVEECESLCMASEKLDACDQELEPGPCRGNYHRWYFHKESKTCQIFSYGGCKGNKNNFHTEEACSAKCLSPEKPRVSVLLNKCDEPVMPGPCNDSITRWHFDAKKNDCLQFTYGGCKGNDNRFTSKKECLLECAANAENLIAPEKDTCTLAALEGECHNFTIRYFFDSLDRRCKQFYYGGCGGNHNNFLSEAECLQRCDSESAPKEIPQEFSIDMCFLALDPGPCREFETRWFYDSQDGVCKTFDYGGCQGNGNKFNSQEECAYHCTHAQDRCALPLVSGSCDEHISAWYFDAGIESCRRFDYGGCDGNANRFNTREECMSSCWKEPKPTMSPYLPDICWKPVDPGPCLQQVTSWFYDSSINRCQEFKYGGCEGNANRFSSEEQCERQCGQFRRHDTCSENKDVGSCGQQIHKWYFERGSEACIEFLYSGCGGNTNRYSSSAECEDICLHKREPFITPGENSWAANQEICSLPPEPGSCVDYIKRYHYDSGSQTCVSFIFTGCSGNLNNFLSFDECILFCSPPTKPNEIDVEKSECWEAEQECSSLSCQYGIITKQDSSGCPLCACHDPCQGFDCAPTEFCSIIVQTNPVTLEHQFSPVCSPITKPGECPDVSDGSCDEMCTADTQCPGDEKCCYNGCGTSCARPLGEHVTYKPPSSGVEPPQIVTDEIDTEVVSREGDYATMKCVVRGSPVPHISWKKDGVLLNGTGSKYRMLSDGTLQVVGLIKDDSGVYICIAENGIGRSVQKEFYLTVDDGIAREASVLGEDNAAVVVSLGSPAVLQCHAIGWPIPSITWWQGSRMLPLTSSEFDQARDNSLVLHSVTLNNLGFYTCQAYNGMKKAASWTVALKAVGPVYSSDPNDVTYDQFLVPDPRRPPSDDRPRPPPYIPRPPPTQPPPPLPTRRPYSVPVRVQLTPDQTEYARGEDVSIGCNVEGFPTPSISWYKDDEPLHSHDRYAISELNRLTIMHAVVADSGTYKCVAENGYSSAEDSVYINVKGMIIPANCTDNRFFANCALIVKGNYCGHQYYAQFCCKSCTEAGLIDPNSVLNRKKRSISPKLLSILPIPLLPNHL